MKIVGQAAKVHARLILCWFAILCVCSIASRAQSPKVPASTPAPGTTATSQAAAIHGVLDLDGPWRFHLGDDPKWADPNFDDSSWQTVKLGSPITEQGVGPYTGYAWYRMRLQPKQLSRSEEHTSELQSPM